jgi:hypothetical protein
LSSPTSTLAAPFGEVGGEGVGSVVDGNEEEMEADCDSAAGSPASSPSNGPASLWKPAVDEKSGKLYWWNTETRKVQWREPDEVVVKVSFLWAFRVVRNLPSPIFCNALLSLSLAVCIPRAFIFYGSTRFELLGT